MFLVIFKLLDWLTRYPAGLKLNDQLNEILNSFFKYHVKLWESNVFLNTSIQ